MESLHFFLTRIGNRNCSRADWIMNRTYWVTIAGETSAVPSGLISYWPLVPTLKRWAILGHPSGMTDESLECLHLFLTRRGSRNQNDEEEEEDEEEELRT